MQNKAALKGSLDGKTTGLLRCQCYFLFEHHQNNPCYISMPYLWDTGKETKEKHTFHV